MNLDLHVTYKGVGDGSVGEQNIISRFVSHKELNKSNDALSLATYGKLTFKKLISFDNNTNQKLDIILQLLNEIKNTTTKSNENFWKD